MEHSEEELPMVPLLLMACMTFMAIVSEMTISGIIPNLVSDLGISELQAGNLVGYYSVAAALVTIPVSMWTVSWNRKRLLLGIIAFYFLGNALIAFSASYPTLIMGRLIGGTAAGALWPMISAFAMKLVPAEHHGRAVAIVLSGATLGISVGLPLMTSIAQFATWRVEMAFVALLFLVLGLGVYFWMPNTPGDERTAENSLSTVLGHGSVWLVMMLVALVVYANYSVYTYQANMLETFAYSGGITLAQSMFGFGSLLAVFITAKYIDSHLQWVTLGVITASIIAFLVFFFVEGASSLWHGAFILWGMGFGPLTTLFQTLASRQVPASATAIVNAIQAAVYDVSIMLGSSLGGVLLVNSGIGLVLQVAMIGLFVANGLVLVSRRIFALR